MGDSEDIVRRVLESGRSLKEFGSSNWALSRAQALIALQAIENASRVLLGGDVWLETNDAFVSTGDSWHFEPSHDQPHAANVRNAATKARAYIAAYPDTAHGVPHFELVLS
jgi:hypothetical protein